MTYDVVIVGGNLSGTSAAINALEKGTSVAIIEKNQEPYLPPHCGEGLDKKTISFINLNKINCHVNPITNIMINLTEKYHITIDSHLHLLSIFDRYHLEKELQIKAQNDGADLFLGTSLKTFNSPYEIITNTNQTISGKVFIDASGITCALGRQIGLKPPLKPQDIGVCIQSRVKGKFDPHMVKLWFHTPYAPNGYCWFFPINDKYANLGLGILGGSHLKLDQLLNSYIKNEYNEDVEILSTFRSCVPMTRPLEKVYKDNVMVVGDAARLVNPFLGSGIMNAVISGSLAGCIAADFLDNTIDSLQLYQMCLTRKINHLSKSYDRREKIFSKDKIIPAYRKALLAFSIGQKIMPNFLQRKINSVVEKDIELIRKFKKTPTLF